MLVDCTFGGGGHTDMLLGEKFGYRHSQAEHSVSTQIYAIDQDSSVFKLNEPLLSKYQERLHPLHGPFSDMERLLGEKGYLICLT